MSLTEDPNDPRLTRGVDPEGSKVPQAEAYLVLPPSTEFIRPVRTAYVHLKCGTVTHMAQRLAETYARQPDFYGATYCAYCRNHRPVGADGEFVWDGTDEKVGT